MNSSRLSSRRTPISFSTLDRCGASATLMLSLLAVITSMLATTRSTSSSMLATLFCPREREVRER